MAKLNYEHVFSGAGFSGDSWNVAKGYDLEFTSAALAVTFLVANSRIQLSSGTFPSWFKVGKYFTTDAPLNPGPFIVKAIISATEIEVHEVLVSEVAVTVVFNGDKDLGIQDILLKTGNGALTDDTPHVLVSTGALGAARQLSIAGMEVESAAKGSMPLPGRFFYLSVQNTDLPTNPLTVVASGTLNGIASLIIDDTGDYLFHHVGSGVWRVNELAAPPTDLATIKRVSFLASDWDAGAIKNTIKIIPSGSPVAGEVGPHGLLVAGSYLAQVINTDLTPDEQVDVEIQFAGDGSITLKKSPKADDFSGVIIIAGSLS